MNKIKIGVPDNKIYSNLIYNINNIKEKNNFEIYRLPSDNIKDLFISNKLDLALINPIDFGLISADSSCQIIPTHCLAMESYTGLVSIELGKDFKDKYKMTFPKNESHLATFTSIVLAERYDCFPEETFSDDNPNIIVECNVKYNENNNSILELSELWFDTFEIPLVLGFWVCSKDFNKANLISLTNELFNNELEDETIIIEADNSVKDDFLREGIIHNKWTEDIKQSLEETLGILFAHCIIEEVPEIKYFNFINK